VFKVIRITGSPRLLYKTRPENMYESLAIYLYVTTGVPFALLIRYVKSLFMGNKQKLYQQLRYLHELIQPRVKVNVPAITRANTLHNSDGLYSIKEGQRNSLGISNLNNVVSNILSYALPPLLRGSPFFP